MRRYTPKQQAEFKASFIEKQRYQVAIYVPLVGAVALLVLSTRPDSDLWQEPGTMVLGTLALVLTTVVFSWFNWRCPACARYLGRGLNPAECPKCGVELRAR